ncbi:MAG: tRNA preQ1(34) S-adenosylmethionine ribosyltransferase-isomerase QueA [Brevundimonas sp.]|uniref:tRNA preQ1(34) S-adenosylmethionine ribosyltransferase-isomerase QueA n=1 Tax=Brevundimonas sp. TaxID=1871086 RepID=UPI000DB09331|nr:tRNA preQ1(34) S-adenosylmethionine ribosyltransferase-isomerase QueA [Brevundimonas sp.]PZU71210.1 MAG: tRNA preQ1(34) S-adenosylmethionine ribosyltransferase-isomerase QueA [Brevundimonas sp.]
MRSFTLSDFDFDLPAELVAQHPAAERSASRLLDGTTSPPPGRPKAASTPSGGSGPREAGERGGLAPRPTDRIFRALPSLLRPGDLLVFNDTQVVKARLFGEKPTGGKLETLLGRWPEENGALFRFAFESPAGEDPYALMARCGHVPLPPYIEHGDSEDDERRYQTVFARVPGAVAAPTAALHFDEALLAELDARGVQRANVTLHVGAGTFQPVKTENIAEHTMHAERYDVPPATQQAIADCHARGGRIVAVGTTTVRTLESWAASGQAQGDTQIFITPGFRFRHVDLLITNFHLPKSTLMMLVSALAGYEHVMALYAHAIRERYRFFSYGDAMLLERAAP